MASNPTVIRTSTRVRREANGLVRGLAGFVVRFRRIVYGKAGSVLTPGLAEFGISKRVVGIQTNRLLQECDRLSDAISRLLLKIKIRLQDCVVSSRIFA